MCLKPSNAIDPGGCVWKITCMYTYNLIVFGAVSHSYWAGYWRCRSFCVIHRAQSVWDKTGSNLSCGIWVNHLGNINFEVYEIYCLWNGLVFSDQINLFKWWFECFTDFAAMVTPVIFVYISCRIQLGNSGSKLAPQIWPGPPTNFMLAFSQFWWVSVQCHCENTAILFSCRYWCWLRWVSCLVSSFNFVVLQACMEDDVKGWLCFFQGALAPYYTP